MTFAKMHYFVRMGAVRLLVSGLFLSYGLQAQTWQAINPNVPGAVTGGNMRPFDSDGTRLYVLGNRGVFVSADNGNSFTPINEVSGTSSYTLTNLSHRFIKCVNGSVWVGSDPGSAAMNLGHASLHRLTPGQTVWVKSSNGFPVGDTGNQADDIAYDGSIGVYYVAAALGGSFVSSDGANWTKRTVGLGGLGLPASVVSFNGLAFESRPLAHVFKTSNLGTNWVELASHSGLSGAFLMEWNGRVLFSVSGATTPADGLYYTDDNGATWNFLTGLRGQADLTSRDGLIFAGGVFGGLVEVIQGRYGFKFSATGGLSWDNLPTNGLPQDAFTGLNLDRVVRQGNYLFAHSGTNLYRCDVSGFDFRPTTQILRQPATNVNLLVGSPLNLSVWGIGTNVTFQWRVNGTNIAGANSTNFSIGAVQLTNSGNYTVVVSGDRGSVTSSVSLVTVVERIDGNYDITYRNPTTSGQTFVLPDGSVLAVNVASIYKFSPGGILLTNRTVTGANFTANLLDRSNRLVLASTVATGLNRLRRVNTTDLTDDTSFDQVTTEHYIASVAELPGRGYVMAGWFSYATNSVSTNAVNQICLVNYAGRLDYSFPGGAGPGVTYAGTPQLSRVLVVGDTNIFVSGSFNLWNGASLSPQGLFRLNADGTLNPNFSYLAFNGSYFFQAHPSGKIFTVTGNSQPKLVNPDGTVDPSFNAANASFNIAQNVVCVAIGESNKIYIAGNGQLTSYAGHPVGKYLRLNADGTFDSSFICTNGPSTGGGFTWVSYDPRGYIYLTRDSNGGNFQGQAFGYGPYRLFAGVTGSAPSGFNAWVTQFAFPPGKNNPGDDADGDGVANVFEYYFGSNPTNAASAGIPAEITVTVGGLKYPAITFRRSKAVSGVTLLPRVSSTLGFADSLGATEESVVDLGDGTEQVTLRSNVSLNALPMQFLRIQLSAL